MTPYAKRIALRASLLDSLNLALALPIYDTDLVVALEAVIEALEERIGLDEIRQDAFAAKVKAGLGKGGDA